jgi:iron-sulfur cluster assembly accessory protein
MSDTTATNKEIFDAGIKMTKKAAERLRAVMDADGKKGFGLRMEVTTGGCSGLNYDMSFEENQKEFDKVFESQGMQIFCDLKSYLYLKGVKIDFSNDILNGGFKIVNPNAERTCGCGTSFSA